MLHVFGSSASYAVVILVVILAFGALVVVHELGHLVMARLCGMRVERFSIGFGPVLLKWQKGATEWALSVIPFGGYVKIAGMGTGEEVAEDDLGAYANKPAWRRFLVILAGPAMNYATAVLLAAVMMATMGVPRADPGSVIGRIIPGGPADRAGLRSGDQVLSVDGRPVSTWEGLVAEIVAHPDKPATLSIRRGNAEPITVVATPQDVGGRGVLRVEQSATLIRASGPSEALSGGFQLTNHRAASILSGLGQMVTGRQRAELRGPIGIAQEMARSARAGAAPFVTIVWFISIALALFNLLPLPALDGGRLVFLGYEIVTRRRVNQRVEGIVHMAGFIALFGLLLAVTLFGDLARIFRP